MRLRRKTVIAAILIILFVLCAVIVIYPFWPSIKYKLFSTEIEESEQIIASDSFDAPISEIKENLLVIPKIGVSIQIVEGQDESALNKGAWRMPQTSTPDKGSNTVITGHRWKYRPPSEKTFYLLDKLETGDMFQVYWEGHKYDYKVVSVSIVLPTDLSVLDPTSNSVVTLITCTPLFSIEKRLIVRGEKI